MFHSIWSKSLRDYRVPILSWGIGLGLLMVIGFTTATPVVLAGIASMAPLLHFWGDAYAIQTPEGYITFRYLEIFLPVILSIWFILAGAQLVRGEEERGIIDVLLATPQPRARLLLEKIGALLAAAILIALLIALGTLIGESGRNEQIDAVRALFTGLNATSLAFFFGTVALLISQWTTSRSAAAGATGGLMVLALLLDIASRELSGSWLSYFSPFYYYNINRPLIPSFHDQPLAALLLISLSLLFILLSLVLFVKRDIGRPAFSWQGKQGSSNHQAQRSLDRAERAISTRAISLHALFAQGWSSFWWLFGITFFCAFCLSLTPAIQKPFENIVQGTPLLRSLFFDTPVNTNTALLGTIIFTFMPALTVVLALTLALSWTADIENGRLELILATPNSRPRILLERFGANFLIILLVPMLTWLSITIGTQLTNLSVDQGRILAASFSVLPPALITISLVYALTGRLRYPAVLSIATLYLVLAFLEETFEGMIQMPSWAMSLSIFHLYGNPIFLGMNWNNFLEMTGGGLVLLIIGLLQFRTADVKLG